MEQLDAYQSAYKQRLEQLQQLIIQSQRTDDLVAIGKKGKEVIANYYRHLPTTKIVKVQQNMSQDQVRELSTQGYTIKINSMGFDIYAPSAKSVRDEELSFQNLLVHAHFVKGDGMLLAKGHQELYHRLAEIKGNENNRTLESIGDEIFKKRMHVIADYYQSHNVDISDFLHLEKKMYASFKQLGDKPSDLPPMLQQYKKMLQDKGITSLTTPISAKQTWAKGIAAGTALSALVAMAAGYVILQKDEPTVIPIEVKTPVFLEQKVETPLQLGDLRLLESHLKYYTPSAVPEQQPILEQKKITSKAPVTPRTESRVNLLYEFSFHGENILYTSPIWLLYPQESITACTDTFDDLKSISTCIPQADRGLARERTDCSKKHKKIQSKRKRDIAIFDCITKIKTSEHQKAKKVLK